MDRAAEWCKGIRRVIRHEITHEELMKQMGVEEVPQWVQCGLSDALKLEVEDGC